MGITPVVGVNFTSGNKARVACIAARRKVLGYIGCSTKFTREVSFVVWCVFVFSQLFGDHRVEEANYNYIGWYKLWNLEEVDLKISLCKIINEPIENDHVMYVSMKDKETKQKKPDRRACGFTYQELGDSVIHHVKEETTSHVPGLSYTPCMQLNNGK